MVSVYSAAADLKSGQFNRKRDSEKANNECRMVYFKKDRAQRFYPSKFCSSLFRPRFIYGFGCQKFEDSFLEFGTRSAEDGKCLDISNYYFNAYSISVLLVINSTNSINQSTQSTQSTNKRYQLFLPTTPATTWDI